MVFWICVGIGRVLGVFDQRNFLPVTDDALHGSPQLVNHIAICCVLGIIGMLVIVFFPESSLMLWAGIAIFGFGFSPLISFSYDLNNRLTLPTEKSTALVMVI